MVSSVVYFCKCSVCGFSFYLPREDKRSCRVCGTWYAREKKNDYKSAVIIEQPKRTRKEE